MTRALGPWGRDGEGTWSDGPVGFGHRLMISTAQDRWEDQPVRQAGTGHVLVADARIDNRDDLARMLDIPAGEARLLPDSAFILAAYKKWGERCAERLLGDFAFALWDPRRRRLLLARDQLGNRVIFYHQTARSIAFATFPTGLFALPQIPRRLSLNVLASHLGHVRSPEAGTSYFEGIQRLPQAYVLTTSGGDTRAIRYWSADDAPPVRLASDSEYVEAFQEQFDEAVRSRLRSTTPIGAFLSGGLDSPAIAAVAAKHLRSSGQRLSAFCSVPQSGFAGGEARPGWEDDETPYVRSIAQWIDNLDLDLVNADGRAILDGLDELHAVIASPMVAPFNRIWMDEIARTASSQQIGVLLDGWGGNLTMSWSGDSLYASLARSYEWRAMIREARTDSRVNSVPIWRVLAKGLRPLAQPGAVRTPWQARASQRMLRGASMINPDLAAELSIWDRGSRREDPGDVTSARSTYFSAEGRKSGDYNSAQRARFGVDVRNPAVDLRIIEFCLAIPEHQFRQNGVGRSLIRRAVDGKLPPDVVLRETRGSQGVDWQDRIAASRPQLEVLLSRLERSDLARSLLDLGQLRASMEPGNQFHSKAAATALMCAFTTGHFVLAWE